MLQVRRIKQITNKIHKEKERPYGRPYLCCQGL